MDSVYVSARTTATIYPQDVDDIVCHRVKAGGEQFLIRWKTHSSVKRAIWSWHALEELRACIHLIQSYVEKNATAQRNPIGLAALPKNRKRKSPDLDAVSRDGDWNGLLTPGDSLTPVRSRSQSLSGISTNLEIANADQDDDQIYNAHLQRKEGRISIDLKRTQSVKIGAVQLPTQAMLAACCSVPLPQTEKWIRGAFTAKLRDFRGVDLENEIDSSTPPLSFELIKSYVYGEGVIQTPLETYVGCQRACKPNMGQNIGCEYTSCECLEYADEIPTDSGPVKRFPYTKPNLKNPNMPCTLVPIYRESRYPIYECNQNCNCGPRCKTRLVQKGRRVPLTIFKTKNRGWGVKCGEDLIPGEFIDTYLGEVITNDEAELRESGGGVEKNSYLYSLDKFVKEDEDITMDNCHVVDGQFKGGPSRFFNHSCEPNVRQFTVSYNKHDRWLYDIAFFALKHIPAGEELTFDYDDQDELELDDAIRARKAAESDPENDDKVRCNCGAEKCRGFLWLPPKTTDAAGGAQRVVDKVVVEKMVVEKAVVDQVVVEISDDEL